ncbi:MAG: ABC transporter permease [Bacillota bacterium]
MAVRLLKSVRTSAWFGWQNESNWTDPLLFAGYALLKPVASSLILVCMYTVVSRTQPQGSLFNYIYVGNAFFMFVANIVFGVSWTIIEDREYFQILKYVYLSTNSVPSYLVGRAGAKFLLATFSALAILLAGRFLLGIPLALTTIRWGLFLPVFVLGVFSCIGLGLIMAGLMLIAARHGGVYAEGVAGIFYLLCGAVFPIEVLPKPLQALSLYIPLTHWLEGIRRAILGGSISPRLAVYNDAQLVLILTATAVGTLVLGWLSFILLDRFARSRGLIDMLTQS